MLPPLLGSLHLAFAFPYLPELLASFTSPDDGLKCSKVCLSCCDLVTLDWRISFKTYIGLLFFFFFRNILLTWPALYLWFSLDLLECSKLKDTLESSNVNSIEWAFGSWWNLEGNVELQASYVRFHSHKTSLAIDLGFLLHWSVRSQKPGFLPCLSFLPHDLIRWPTTW